MNPSFEAERMRDIPFSSIRKVFEKVTQLNERGQAPVPFHIGRPDFDTPDHIKAAAKEALDKGLTAYTSNYGLAELRLAIAAKLFEDNGVRVDYNRQIIVTAGANEAVLLAMMAFLNPGDEVLIPDPMWLHYFYCARLAGASVVSVPLTAENKFQLDPDDLKRLITPRTKMLVINSPHNPTGAVFSREVIEAAAAFAAQHGLILLFDEIYEKLIYDGVKHFSPITIESASDRTIIVNGFSKSYAMTGWRLGYVAANEKLISTMIRVHQYTTVCATSFAQAGAVRALEGPQDCLNQMMGEFSRRRRVVIDAFQQIDSEALVPPMGTFYAFPKITALEKSSEVVEGELLDRAGVAVVNGKAFGVYGEGHVRLSYACSFSEVQRGMTSIGEYWTSKLDGRGAR